MDSIPKCFYDTKALLNNYDKILNSDEHFVISVYTFDELDDILMSRYKSTDVKYKADKTIQALSAHRDKYDVVLATDEILNTLNVFMLDETFPNVIFATMIYYYNNVAKINVVVGDLYLYYLFKQLTTIPVMFDKENFTQCQNDVYKGYKELYLNNEQYQLLYDKPKVNSFNCLVNEYLIIDDENKNPIDAYRWTGEEYKHISSHGVKSKFFGDVKLLDIYQKCAFDSLKYNQITCLFGKAGAGKTMLPMVYLMSQIEKGNIDKIYFVYHFEPLKNSRQLGYVKGSLTEKSMQTGSIGNILASKFGDITEVERLINDNKIEIIPTANIRGMEFKSNTAVFVTEAQDIDVYTLKTIIQRCKKHCLLIVEGDILEQSDIDKLQSGMKRMIDVFKGYNQFGCVKLRKCYRSDISELADKM